MINIIRKFVEGESQNAMLDFYKLIFERENPTLKFDVVAALASGYKTKTIQQIRTGRGYASVDALLAIDEQTGLPVATIWMAQIIGKYGALDTIAHFINGEHT